jgi:hypothetical protein
MRDADLTEILVRNLAVYGSELSRWPDHGEEARAALLGNLDFRRAWERERDLDRRLAADREALDAEVLRSGTLQRLKRNLLLGEADPLAGIPWSRVAAVVLLAGMLGGALDLLLPEPASEPLDVAIVDPLDGLDLVEMR